MKSLEVTVEKNLRIYVMTQVFRQKDYSISDAYFYINNCIWNIAFDTILISSCNVKYKFA